ncbi:MAG: GNAT family N-acetyltransferase, partial [Kangiellaceae bacterium]|nr:GNAT family N-acetyltransferase [Kangiellaceae bacterium]
NQENDFNKIWVKKTDGNNAGYVAVSDKGEETAFVNFFLVLSEFRGKGVAQELMSHAIEYSRINGATKVLLETYDCLTAARKIYTHFGFTINEQTEFLNKYGRKFKQEFWELNLK